MTRQNWSTEVQQRWPPTERKSSRKPRGKSQSVNQSDLFFLSVLPKLKKVVSTHCRRPRAAESQLTEVLGVEEDEVLNEAPPPFPQHSLFSVPQGQSQSMGKVFVERSSE